MKMRILLGSALLAIACGFPTGAPLATTVVPEAKPSVEQLIDEYVNRAKAAASEASEETTTAEPTTTEEPKLREDINEIINVFAAANIPSEAINDFIEQGFHLASDDEESTAQRVNEWARKWGITEQLKEGAQRVRDASTTTAQPRISEHINELFDLFHAANIPHEAINDFIDRGLHLVYDENETASMQRFMEWAHKWDVVKQLEDAANARQATATPEPEKTTTWTTTTEAVYETTTVKDAAEELIRERFSKMGFPEEAINEYFALGLASDSQDEEWQSLFTAWCNKWKHALPHYNEAKAMHQEIMNEVSQIFEKTYMAVSIMQALSYSDEQPTEEHMELMKTYFDNLTEYEKELVSRVMQHVGEKVAKKFMKKIEAVKQEKNVNTNSAAYLQKANEIGLEIIEKTARHFNNVYAFASTLFEEESEGPPAYAYDSQRYPSWEKRVNGRLRKASPFEAATLARVYGLIGNATAKEHNMPPGVCEAVIWNFSGLLTGERTAADNHQIILAIAEDPEYQKRANQMGADIAKRAAEFFHNTAELCNSLRGLVEEGTVLHKPSMEKKKAFYARAGQLSQDEAIVVRDVSLLIMEETARKYGISEKEAFGIMNNFTELSG